MVKKPSKVERNTLCCGQKNLQTGRKKTFKESLLRGVKKARVLRTKNQPCLGLKLLCTTWTIAFANIWRMMRLCHQTWQLAASRSCTPLATGVLCGRPCVPVHFVFPVYILATRCKQSSAVRRVVPPQIRLLLPSTCTPDLSGSAGVPGLSVPSREVSTCMTPPPLYF